MKTNYRITQAFETRDIEEFLHLIFPSAWKGVAARIVESGATFSQDMCAWAPRWSKIPPTIREGKDATETAFKSCVFRVHDCLHQLWGLPLPSERMDQDDFYEYKRAQMCGEVAVLVLTEFEFAKYWYQTCPELRDVIRRRNAIQMIEGPLQAKTTLQIAQRMDDLLHKKSRPRWVRGHTESEAFVEDYVPMLEFDRTNIDHNWGLMKDARWRPTTAPNSRYSPHLDGLELTQWMITDFFHLIDTDGVVDVPLRDFNRARREDIVLPKWWNGANRPEHAPVQLTAQDRKLHWRTWDLLYQIQQATDGEDPRQRSGEMTERGLSVAMTVEMRALETRKWAECYGTAECETEQGNMRVMPTWRITTEGRAALRLRNK